MTAFGDKLRAERERRNVPLDEIAESTKIRVRYLRALEDGLHDRLPGIVFAKGYVRAYADAIGADADRLVDAYVEEQRALGRLEDPSSDDVLKALAAAVETPRSGFPWKAVVLVLVVATVGAGGWFGYRAWSSRPASSAAAPAGTVAANRTQPIAPREQPARPAHEPVLETKSEDPQPAETIVEPPPEPAATEDVVTETVETTPPPSAAEETFAPAPEDTTVAAPAMVVSEQGIGSEVRDRALVGRADEFTVGGPVVFWTRVIDGSKGDVLRHVLMFEGNEVAALDLRIGGPHWRTYSRWTPGRTGSWSIEARTPDGRVLARAEFRIVDESGA